MKFRIIFVLITFLVASCGIWKESGSNVSVEEDQTAPVRTGPVVYVYTGPEFSRASLLEPLIAEYDPEAAGTLVRPFSSVSGLDEPEHGAIILTIGADANIIRPLTRLAERRRDLRILSLFSLDDPVLLEYFSELVVDSSTSRESSSPESETREIPVPDEELSLLVLSIVRYADERDWNRSRSEQLLGHLDSAFRSAGKNGIPPGWDVLPYTDPESGIRSRNHLTLHLPGRTAQ